MHDKIKKDRERLIAEITQLNEKLNDLEVKAN